MDTVYPPEKVDSGLRQKLAEDHPSSLIVWNPVYKRWQMFELPKGSEWTARRLYEAICQHHARIEREHGRFLKPEWARWRGAPIMRDVLPRWPGWWLVEWLNQNDLWRFPGGAKAWLQQIEAEEQRKQDAAQQGIHDLAHDVSHSGFERHAADILRGDPLGGERKWVHTNPGYVKEVETDARTESGSGEGTVQSKD